jgi:hypothetical protein
MLPTIKQIRNVMGIYKTISRNPYIFKVVEDIFKFLETTHKEQKPMVTKIVLLNMAEGTKIGDFVSLWAGIGDTNPIERARHLKAQNTELKRLLQLYFDDTITQEDIELAGITLKIFD